MSSLRLQETERATGVRTVHPIEVLHRAAGLG